MPRPRSSASTSRPRSAPERWSASARSRRPRHTSRSVICGSRRRWRVSRSTRWSSPAAPRRAHSGRRSSPTCSASRCAIPVVKESTRPGRGRLRRSRRRSLPRAPGRRRRIGCPHRANRSSPTRDAHAAYSRAVQPLARALRPIPRALRGRARAPALARGRHLNDERTCNARSGHQRRQELLRGDPGGDQGFFLKGSGSYDWGMKNRLARIFRPETGRTVMLAIDHGYFQGPTTGLERVDLSIVPIAPLRRRARC